MIKASEAYVPSQFSLLQKDKPSLLDFIHYTLDENYVSSEEVPQDMRNNTAAIDLNNDTLVNHGDLHSNSPRGEGSHGNGLPGGATPEESI